MADIDRVTTAIALHFPSPPKQAGFDWPAHRAFDHGQVYVALSRCQTMDGLNLERPIIAADIHVDPAVVAFSE